MITIKERHHHRFQKSHPAIVEYLDNIGEDEKRNVAAQTIQFIKDAFPEVADVMRGEIILEYTEE